MGRQGLGVNTLVPTLFISGHTPWPLELVSERECPWGRTTWGQVREGRTSHQGEAVPAELGKGAERSPPGRDRVCRKAMWYALKEGGSPGSQSANLIHQNLLHNHMALKKTIDRVVFPGGAEREPKCHRRRTNSIRTGKWWLSSLALRSQRHCISVHVACVATVTAAEGRDRFASSQGWPRCWEGKVSLKTCLLLSFFQKKTSPVCNSWTHHPRVDLPYLFLQLLFHHCLSYVIRAHSLPSLKHFKGFFSFSLLFWGTPMLLTDCSVHLFCFALAKQGYCQHGRGQYFRAGWGQGKGSSGEKRAWWRPGGACRTFYLSSLSSWPMNY